MIGKPLEVPRKNKSKDIGSFTVQKRFTKKVSIRNLVTDPRIFFLYDQGNLNELLDVGIQPLRINPLNKAAELHSKSR